MADCPCSAGLGANVGSHEIQSAQFSREVLLRGDQGIETGGHRGFLTVEAGQCGLDLGNGAGIEDIGWRGGFVD